MFYCFELIKVTVADGPVGVLLPPSSELPKSYRFVIPGINFGKVPDAVTDFLFFWIN